MDGDDELFFDAAENFEEVLRMQLERYQELERQVVDQQHEIENIHYKGFEVAMCYFLSQDIFLAATNNSSSLGCSYVWYMFVLSLFPVILGLCAFFFLAVDKHMVVMNRYHKTWLDWNDLERGIPNRDLVNDRSTLVRDGEKRRRRRQWMLIFCMAILAIFTIILLSSPWTVMCKRDREKRRGNFSS